ncbi:hypothetical protein OCV99_10910, partial [Dorea acetigenes]
WWTPPKANISAIFKVPMEPFFQLHFFIDYFTLPLFLNAFIEETIAFLYQKEYGRICLFIVFL